MPNEKKMRSLPCTPHFFSKKLHTRIFQLLTVFFSLCDEPFFGYRWERKPPRFGPRANAWMERRSWPPWHSEVVSLCVCVCVLPVRGACCIHDTPVKTRKGSPENTGEKEKHRPKTRIFGFKNVSFGECTCF